MEQRRTCAQLTACVPHSCRPDRRARVGQRVDHSTALVAAQGNASGRSGAAMPWNDGDLHIFMPTPPLTDADLDGLHSRVQAALRDVLRNVIPEIKFTSDINLKLLFLIQLRLLFC